MKLILYEFPEISIITKNSFDKISHQSTIWFQRINILLNKSQGCTQPPIQHGHYSSSLYHWFVLPAQI